MREDENKKDPEEIRYSGGSGGDGCGSFINLNVCIQYTHKLYRTDGRAREEWNFVFRNASSLLQHLTFELFDVNMSGDALNASTQLISESNKSQR